MTRFLALLLSAVYAVVLAAPARADLVTSINGNAAWWKADSLNLANGAPVTSWADSSGNGHNATAVSAPVFQAGGFNGRAAVQFNSHLMTFSPVTLATNTTLDLSIFSAIRVDDTTTGFYLGHTDSAKIGPHNDSHFIRVRPTGGGGTEYQAPWTIGNNPGMIYAERQAGGLVGSRMNGGTLSTGNSQTQTSGQLTAFSRMGMDNGTTNVLNGAIAELILFDRRVNDAERILVENYLSSKYDIALGVGATNAYSGETLGYDRDVFGIGRASDGSQLQTAHAAGLRLNSTTLANGQFIMAGHDGTDHGLIDFVDGNLLGQQWERDWYVDTNNNSIETTLTFDFDEADLSGLFDAGASYSLLYNETGDSSGWQILSVLASVGSNQVSFLVPAAMFDTGFYTLGINIALVPEPSTALLLGLGGLAMLAGRRRKARG